MNAPLRRVAISVLVLFTMLIVNVNVIQVWRADSLRDNPSNTRVLSEEYDRQRGSIVVGGNEIAVSTRTDDTLTYLRSYPQGPVYAAVTGYYSLLYGAKALERSENDVLTGSDPRLFGRRLADLFTGRDLTGGNVVLTLDPAAQEAAMAGLDGVTGAVVALEPSTGRVLAMGSTPTYDPTQLSSHDPDAIRAYSEQLDGQTPSPLVNQATAERHSPGSVFKVIVSAAALEDGYTPQTTVPAPNELILPGTSTPLRNYDSESCNSGADQSLLAALTISCNTAFAQLGIDLGEDKVTDMAEAFGIDDEPFAIPLQVAGSTLGDITDDAQLGQSSIGQFEVQITPVQAAMIAATVANGGTEMAPYLVDQIQAPDLSVEDQTEPEERGRPISSATADGLTEMMTSVVSDGTGRKAQIPGVQVAGKTGTAQTTPDAPDNQWFIGFAPADDPTIAIAVYVAGQSGTGGDVSAPIAQRVMAAYLTSQAGD